MKKPDADRSITDVATEFGVSLRTLRFYEDRGLIRPIRNGSKRMYSAEDRLRVGIILKGKKLGFTLLEIERLVLGGPIEDQPSGAPIDFAGRMHPDAVAEQIVVLERRRKTLTTAIKELRDVQSAMEKGKVLEGVD